jgi:PPM family protein phosphatase
MDRADRKLRDEAEEDLTLKGMGTTLTAVSMIGVDAFLVHVGDSRAYLLRDGAMFPATGRKSVPPCVPDADRGNES